MKIKKTYGAVCLIALLLTACSMHKLRPILPSTETVLGQPMPAGQALPLHYSYDAGRDGVRYQVVSFSDLPQWSQQSFGQSLRAFKKSCEKLQSQSTWQNVCQQANQINETDFQAKRFFEHYFTPWQIMQYGRLDGMVTGYYEPMLLGDNRQTRQARFPIYGIPDDFISVPLTIAQRQGFVKIRLTGTHSGIITANGSYNANLNAFPINAKTKTLKGRISGNQFVPYYTRAQINAGALNGKARILGYANDPVELFFLHVQGSGRLQTPNGQMIHLGFADKNDYPYVSIGKYMASKGYLPLSQTSMQGIKLWLQQHPDKLAEVLGQNPSYVFFQEPNDSIGGPIGALGVTLTGGYSGAVDRHFIQLGAPLFLATTHPENGNGLNRLIMAQDTGSAINGAVRVDYFWGYGDAAGRLAGKMKHTGYVWQLLPKGVLPL